MFQGLFNSETEQMLRLIMQSQKSQGSRFNQKQKQCILKVLSQKSAGGQANLLRSPKKSKLESSEKKEKKTKDLLAKNFFTKQNLKIKNDNDFLKCQRFNSLIEPSDFE